MPPASEVLASASLLLAATSALFGLWYPGIRDAAALKVPDHLKDAKHERAAVETALGRAGPLLLAYGIVAVTFLPVVVAEVVGSVINLTAKGWRALGDYDPSGVALTAVVGLAGWFGWILHCDRRKLRDLRSRLEVNGRAG